MTPTVREALQGVVTALAQPIPPEAGPDYAASRVGMASMLTMLAAQEAEAAAGAAIAENAAIRALFAEVAAGAAGLDAELADAARETDADLSTPALDAANARLRRLLTRLHEAAEARGDAAADARILALYARMAELRRMPMGA